MTVPAMVILLLQRLGEPLRPALRGPLVACIHCIPELLTPAQLFVLQGATLGRVFSQSDGTQVQLDPKPTA